MCDEDEDEEEKLVRLHPSVRNKFWIHMDPETGF